MNIAAIILAGGQSRRFGKTNKLFANYKGAPLIDHCINLVLGFEFAERIIVTGFENQRLNVHIARLPFRAVHNSDYDQGMGTSLATGVKTLKQDPDAFMVFLADMPDIPKQTIRDLITPFKANENSTIVRPTYNEKPGHPVLFASSHQTELSNLKGDRGATDLIKKYKTSTLNVEVSSPGVVRDIDRGVDID